MIYKVANAEEFEATFNKTTMGDSVVASIPFSYSVHNWLEQGDSGVPISGIKLVNTLP